MSNWFRIAVNAFRESVREPIFCLMLLAALVLILHYPSIAAFTFSEQLKMVEDSAMATTLIFAMVTGILASGNVVSREMRNGTVLLLLAKPVSPAAFVLGKMSGVVAAAAGFALVCGAAAIVAANITPEAYTINLPLYCWSLALLALAAAGGMAANFWRGSSFSEVTSGLLALFIPADAAYCAFFRHGPEVGNFALALLLVVMAVIAMAAIAAALAAKLDLVPNLCVCTAIFFLGLVSSFLFQRETGSALLDLCCSAGYAVVPNWQYFWLADAVATHREIPAGYLLRAAAYMTLYVALVGLWAVRLFSDQEAAGALRS